MPDLLQILKRRWKLILLLMLLPLAAVTVFVFTKRGSYLSVCTAVPASMYATDRAGIFNKNIESLYTGLGSPDDLDLVTGTAKLDTLYLLVTDRFNLYDHYKIKDEIKKARLKAARLLMKNTQVSKSEYGELKVRVWNTDKNLAPQLANALMQELNTIHTRIRNSYNDAILKELEKRKAAFEKQSDSTARHPEKSKDAEMQLLQTNELMNEYRLITESKPPALVVVDAARPALRPDKPKKWQAIAGTAFLSMIFAFFVALLADRSKK